MYKYLAVWFVLLTSVCYAQNCDFLSYGRCLSCDTPVIIKTETADACTKHCPNRQVKHFSDMTDEYVLCSLKECPKEFPLRDALGGCHKCDVVEKTSPTNEVSQMAAYTNCEVCENRYRDEQGFCQFKDGTELPYFPEYEDNTVSTEFCDQEGFFMTHENKCYSCAGLYPIGIYGEEHIKQHNEKCPNRMIKKGFWGDISVIKCPKKRPLMDKYGNCWKCNEETPLSLSENDERICGSMRYEYYDMSYLCPEQKKYLTKKQCQSCAGVFEDEVCR